MKHTANHYYNKSHQSSRASPDNTKGNRRSMSKNNNKCIIANYLANMPSPVGHCNMNKNKAKKNFKIKFIFFPKEHKRSPNRTQPP